MADETPGAAAQPAAPDASEWDLDLDAIVPVVRHFTFKKTRYAVYLMIDLSHKQVAEIMRLEKEIPKIESADKRNEEIRRQARMICPPPEDGGPSDDVIMEMSQTQLERIFSLSLGFAGRPPQPASPSGPTTSGEGSSETSPAAPSSTPG